MLVYWTMYAVPAASALFAQSANKGEVRARWLFAALLLAFVLLIGLRWEVGGDWFNYEQMVEFSRYETLAVTLSHGDPGFGFISWLSTRAGLGQEGPNTICGGLLVWGIWRFARRQPDAWLALATAVPYLLIVVGMGYVRQAGAIGLLLIAINSFEDGKLLRPFVLLAISATFHASSVAMVAVFGLVLLRQRPLLFVPLLLLTAIAWGSLLQSRLDHFYSSYVLVDQDSSGAFVRLVMNTVPAVLFLMLRKRFDLSDAMRAFWTGLALLSCLLVVLAQLTTLSTALDRVGLYLIPIQLLVFGRLGSVVAPGSAGQIVVRLAVIGYYGAALYIWLNFATHSGAWLPYRFMPLET